MAKTMRNAFRAALRWRLDPEPVKNINIGILSGAACSWALLVLGAADTVSVAHERVS
jgi:hypothetical protein